MRSRACSWSSDRDGGAYDFTTGGSVYSPVFDPAWSNEVERGYADVIELENDWDANPNGEGYLQHLEDLPDVRRELEREGIQWGRMVYEDAYQTLAARETATHRAGRANAEPQDLTSTTLPDISSETPGVPVPRDSLLPTLPEATVSSSEPPLESPEEPLPTQELP